MPAKRNVRGLQSAIVCGMAKLAASCGGFAASAAFAGDREGLLGVACDYTRARSKTQKDSKSLEKLNFLLNAGLRKAMLSVRGIRAS